MVQYGSTAVGMLNYESEAGSESCQHLKVMHLTLRTKGDGGWKENVCEYVSASVLVCCLKQMQAVMLCQTERAWSLEHAD